MTAELEGVQGKGTSALNAIKRELDRIVALMKELVFMFYGGCCKGSVKVMR